MSIKRILCELAEDEFGIPCGVREGQVFVHQKKGDSVETTQTSGPWAAQEPYIKRGFRMGQDMYDRGMRASETASAQNPALIAAYQQIADRAGQGDPMALAATEHGQRVLSGGFLNSNPYIDQNFSDASRAVSNQVNSNFSMGGRSMSPAHMGTMTEELGVMANNMYGANYQNERAAQDAMVGQAGQLSALQYAPEQAQIAALQGIQGVNMSESDREAMLIQNYMNTISGNYGGTSTGSTEDKAGALTTAGGIVGGIGALYSGFGGGVA